MDLRVFFLGLVNVRFMKAGFVNIFGKPNAGKSTLLNAVIGEKMAIVSPKVQTTRHRIKAFLTEPGYQIIFSDTPGIIEPKYKLHEKMMQAVKSSLEDADVAILLADVNDDCLEVDALFSKLRLKVPSVFILNKIDAVSPAKAQETAAWYAQKPYAKEMMSISALHGFDRNELIQKLLQYLPESEPFYAEDDLTDLPTRFFVGELIREKIFLLYEDEIPYHTTVLVQEYKEKETLVKIAADIIVQRDTQKGIILGGKGSMIKKLGTEARKDIEAFIGRKVFLELFVKVRPKWRDSELFLREYGYK
jgi:GTP-binding protein Era